MNGRGNFVDIVAYYAKANVLSILFDNTPKSGLCLLSHHISLIKDDELVSFGEQGSCLGKLLNLFPNYVDTTLVRCIELDKRSISGDDKGAGMGMEPREFVCDNRSHRYIEQRPV